MSTTNKRIRSRQLDDDIPAWLSAGWSEDDDVSKKLQMILGEEDAYDILNPTMKAKPTPSFLTPLLGKQQETPCAQTLWNSLRATSQKNLKAQTSKRNNDAFIRQYTRKPTLSSQRADTYRQRVEMMHKVAHMNELKTKRLLETVKLPQITASIGECHHTCIEVDKCKDGQLAGVRNSRADFVAPHKSMRPPSTRNRSSGTTLQSKATALHSHDDENTAVLRNRTPVRFLTETACRTDGKFRDRMRTLGIEPKIGISCPQLNYKSSLAPSSAVVKPTFENMKFKQTLEPLKNGKRATKRNDGKSHSWEPLSLAALAEYTRKIQAPGDGKFNSGRATLWKPKVEEMIA